MHADISPLERVFNVFHRAAFSCIYTFSHKIYFKSFLLLFTLYAEM